jgi:hypothetical protein
MYSQVDDGDIVYLKTPDELLEPALVFRYHARGECELVKGIAHVSSGSFMEIRNWNCNIAWGKELVSKPALKARYDPSTRWVHKLYKAGLHANRLSPFKTGMELEYLKNPSESSFLKAKKPFLGRFDLSQSLRKSTATSIAKLLRRKQFIVDRYVKNRDFKMEVPDLTKFIREALLKKSEGLWVNPIVSKAALKHFGIPKRFLTASVNRSVPEYNQIIFQVDGTDSARTLGMHKDRDGKDKQVATILGCIAAPFSRQQPGRIGQNSPSGKEVIIWCNELVSDMPRWWKNEGLSRSSFLFAKYQCLNVDSIRRNVAILTLRVGDYIFMPKGYWHWVCPSDDADWTVMITSSIY